MTAFDPVVARFNMVQQQIRPWNVLDPAVLELLSQMQRDQFVPEPHRALAYADIEVPLPGGQCMLFPRLEARLLQDLAVQPHETVLEVGSGSGFMAALLAHRAQRVLSLEIDPELARFARTNLRNAAISNVEVREADGSVGAPKDGPFDVILLSGSVAEVPPALLEQLRIGGRLAAVVGDEPVMRAALIKRVTANDFRTETPWDVNAPRLRNFPQASRFQF